MMEQLSHCPLWVLVMAAAGAPVVALCGVAGSCAVGYAISDALDQAEIWLNRQLHKRDLAREARR